MKVHSQCSHKNVSVATEKLLQKNLASIKVYNMLGIALGISPIMQPKRTMTSNLYFYVMLIIYIASLCYVIPQMTNPRDEHVDLLNTKTISYICLFLILNVFVEIITNKKFPVTYFRILAETDTDFSMHNAMLDTNFYRVAYLVQLNYMIYLTISNSVKLVLLLSFAECDVIQQIILSVGTLCKSYVLHMLILILFYVGLRFKKINEIVRYLQNGRILRNKSGHGKLTINFIPLTTFPRIYYKLIFIHLLGVK